MKKVRDYNDSVHFYGRLSMVFILIVFIGVPLSMCIFYNAWPKPSAVIKGLIPIAMLYCPTAVVEVLTYAPLLGTGGMYISFITGDISNLKLPCAIAAMNAAKVKPSSEEGEIISTISIAASSIATIVIVAICVFFLRPIIPIITDETSVFAPAFAHVLPALFGAIGAAYLLKYPKTVIAPLAVILLILAFSGQMQVGLLIPIGVIVAVVAAHFMYKAKLIK